MYNATRSASGELRTYHWYDLLWPRVAHCSLTYDALNHRLPPPLHSSWRKTDLHSVGRQRTPDIAAGSSFSHRPSSLTAGDSWPPWPSCRRLHDLPSSSIISHCLEVESRKLKYFGHLIRAGLHRSYTVMDVSMATEHSEDRWDVGQMNDLQT